MPVAYAVVRAASRSSCRARRSRRPDTSARSRTDRAGSRASADRATGRSRFGSGPVGLTKQGSLTRPRYSQRLSRLAFSDGMRRQRLQEIERAERGDAEPVPEAIVAGGPDDPRVPSLDFLGRQRHAAVHVAEIVFVGGRKGRGVAADRERLVEDAARLRGAGFLTQRNTATPAARRRPGRRER